jgi:hypothetical protein
MAAPAAHAEISSDKNKQKSGGVGCVWAILGTIAVLAVLGSIGSSNKDNSAVHVSSRETTSPPAPPTPLLELKASRCNKEYSFIISEGTVTNISGEPLKNVEAVAGYYDASGNFIKSGDAIIEYNPILPGQTSPYKTITTDNPAITRCDVSFKFLMGGTIDMRRAEPAKKSKRK